MESKMQTTGRDSSSRALQVPLLGIYADFTQNYYYYYI